MSLASKLSAGLLAAACVCSLAAAEIISINEPTDFQTPKRVVKGEESMSAKGHYFVLLSSKTLTLDPAKKYKISGDFRLKEGEVNPNMYLGFAPYDAEGREITSVCVNATPKSDTVLAKAAVKGDTVICVKDASKWDTKTKSGFVAFDTKPDYSDLPNRDLAAIAPDGIKQNGDVWEITLKKPLTKDVAEGADVRQQKAGATYIYSAYKGKLPQEWVTLSGVTAGSTSLSGNTNRRLWHGTASVRVMVSMLNGKPGTVIEMKNIKVEEVE